MVNQFAEKVDKDKLELTGTLLVSSVLSGCDSVSFSFGLGKKRAANVALGLIGKILKLVDLTHVASPVASL